MRAAPDLAMPVRRLRIAAAAAGPGAGRQSLRSRSGLAAQAMAAMAPDFAGRVGSALGAGLEKMN